MAKARGLPGAKGPPRKRGESERERASVRWRVGREATNCCRVRQRGGGGGGRGAGNGERVESTMVRRQQPYWNRGEREASFPKGRGREMERGRGRPVDGTRPVQRWQQPDGKRLHYLWCLQETILTLEG